MMSNSEAERTVRFNIGGTTYEVSRSLLRQHDSSLLAHMASDTWNPNAAANRPGANTNEDERGLFVERDGARFAYVLDYMRDGEVTLPWLIPTNVFKKDMEYYGLTYADERIFRSASSPLETRLVAEQVRKVSEKAERSFKQTEKEIIALQQKLFCDEIALKVYLQYASTLGTPNATRSPTVFVEDCNIPFSALAGHEVDHFINPMRDALAQYGLDCRGFSFEDTCKAVTNHITYRPESTQPSYRRVLQTMSVDVPVASMRVAVTIASRSP